ncbi:integrin alpha-PS4 [Agrilus planipennis]|uniref:Integrin alpha-PS4 n=1 Tax=Agrilus planipennis TaxID=224129 RepID=A0A1W4XEN3_AGRPL|nr:integrin alpha-PS4 [Agrilus planipennis]
MTNSLCAYIRRYFSRMLVVASAVVFIAVILFGESYNFDTKFPEIILSNYKDDYFGFSVLLQQGTTSVLIASAVKGNSTFEPNSDGVSSGVLYKCVLNGSKLCSEYGVDHEIPPKFNFAAETNYELLGAAIDGGQSVGDPIVVCAPRLRRKLKNGYLANGACFILNNSSLTSKNGEIFIPLLDEQSQFFDNKYLYGNGEAGMSLHFVQEYSEILIGAPGVLTSKGTLIRYQLKEPFQPYSELANQIERVSIPNPYYFSAKLVEYDSYLGYSSSYGVFDESKGFWYVAAAPRAFFLKGKVFMFSYPNTNEQSIIVHNEFVGEQMGAYFGFSLASFKNNNNTNVSDLLVGSPMFSLKGYDEGCVYYYKNDGQAQFGDPIKIFGDVIPGSRFGHAIANLGDINHDSYTDIAISAPYESKEGGAVYIFMGRHFGLSNKYSQKIRGSSIDHNILALGLSLSSGLDIDQNTFNDLAIGDFKSGKVVVIKTKPVIKYFGYLLPDVAELGVAQNIQFNLTFCLTYDGSSGIVKSVETVLYYYPDPRILMTNKTHTVTIKLNNFYCQNLSLTLTNNTINSFATPVRFKVNYEVKDQSGSDFCKTCPITDQGAGNSMYIELPFASGCKNATVCFPDLGVSASFDPNLNYLVIGKNSFLNMKVTVTNSEEPAYLCELILKIPDNIEMRRIANKCTQIESELRCFLKNVLFKNNTIEIDFEFDLTRLTYFPQKNLSFYLEVKSSGNDTNEDNNKINLDLPLKVESFVQINGESHPDQLMYKDMIKFSHKYTFVNLGPSPLPRLDFLVNFPIKIKTEEFVLKYSLQSAIDGVQVECDQFSQDNPLKDDDDTKSNELLEPVKSYFQNTADFNKKDFSLDQVLFINCSKGELITCKTLICHVNQEVKKDQIVRLDFSLEVSLDTIKKQSEIRKMIFYQTAVSTRFNQQRYSNGTTTILMGYSSSTEVSYMIYIVGVLIGVIILSGIIFLLHKLKFFRRPLMEKLVNTEEITSVLGNDSLESEDEPFD